MHGYRAYIVRPDGHIQDSVIIYGETDEDAEQQARKLVDGYAVELWDQARKVATFEPKH